MKISDLYWFLGTFVVIYLFYFFFHIYKKKEFDRNKVPTELMFLIKKYRLDMKRINYPSIMQKIAVISAFDISFVATFSIKFVKNIYLEILAGIGLLIPLILITYSWIGFYYKKKGLVINGNKKN